MTQDNENIDYSFTSYIITKESRDDPEISSIIRSIANLIVEAFVNINPELTVETYLEGIEKITDEQPLYTETVEINGKLIGTIVYTGDKIIDIAVEKNYRKQGYGKKLVKKAIYTISKQPIKSSKIKTEAFTQESIHLFESQGFVPNYYGNGEKSPYLIMEYKLS